MHPLDPLLNFNPLREAGLHREIENSVRTRVHVHKQNCSGGQNPTILVKTGTMRESWKSDENGLSVVHYAKYYNVICFTDKEEKAINDYVNRRYKQFMRNN